MRTAIIAASVWLAATGAATAQDMPGDVFVDQLFSRIESEVGMSSSSSATGRLQEFGIAHGTFDVTLGSTFVLMGVCDQGCSDLDLTVTDPNGDHVGDDNEDDDTPVVAIPPGLGGRYTFEVRMVTCSADCHWGVRAYNAGN